MSKDSEKNDLILKQLNRSGYPFQLKVESEIKLTSNKHGWNVVSREHPWTSEDGQESGFIDLVLKHSQSYTFSLVIECKRMKSDNAQQLQWIFLIPDSNQEVNRTSCFEIQGFKDKKEFRIWDTVGLEPASFEAEFCVLPGDGRQPMLETIAGSVLESVEGLAEEEVKMARSTESSSTMRKFIFSAIVTNADLAVCHFQSEKVNKDGVLDMDDIDIKAVPFIRFRKSVDMDIKGFDNTRYYDLEELRKAQEQTVFVVNIDGLTEFLSNWKMWHLGDGYAFQQVNPDSL